MKKIIYAITIIVVAALWSNSVSAQTTGKIAGKVIDQKTSETLIGATVSIEGTTKGVATDVEGHYVLGGLAAGKYSIVIRYIGYQAKNISDIEVKPNGVTNLDITLEQSASKALSEVVVKATYRTASVASLYARQKNSIQVSDGISSDIIRRSPDRNTGDVLKRIGGTSVQDGKFVVIRGLSERYNNNLLNGTVLPSSEPDKKAFSYDIIPSSLIDNIVVYKTATPDLPGDFAGGAINTITKDIPETKFMEATLNVGYNSKATFKDNFISGQPNGKYDFLGFLDDSRKLPPVYADNKAIYTGGTTANQKIAIAQQFPNTFGSKYISTIPNISFQFVTGNSKVFKNESRLGYNFALNYAAGYRGTTGDRTQYNPSQTNELPPYSFDRNLYSTTKSLGGLFSLGYTFGKNKIALRNLFNNDFSKDFEETVNGVIRGANLNEPTRYRGFSNEVTQNGVFSSVLEGQHTIGERKVIIDWAGSYGLSYRNQPDQRIVTIFQDNNGEFLSLPPENSPFSNTLGRIYSKLNENIYGGKLNVTYPFKWLHQTQKLKAGGLYNYRNRDFSIDALGYVNVRAFGSTQLRLNDGLTIDNVFSPQSIANNNIALARLDLQSTDYKGTANLGAGYLMLDNKFTDKLHLVWGARIERYEQEINAPGKPLQNYVNTDVLPSANLSYALTEKSNLRGSFYKSVNRPEFRELADFRYYDYQNNFNISGNKNLVRSTVSNADIRYEIFPSAGEVISVSGFYKKFINPIEQVNLDNDVLSYQNAISAEDFGAEVELRKKLNFIDETSFLKNLTFYVNASYINAEVKFPNRPDAKTPLQGQSPYLINSGLYYAPESGNFTFNVLYNRVGQRLRFRGVDQLSDIYEKPRDVIDFQFSKRLLNKRAELKLTLSDLLAQTNALYYNFGNVNKTGYNPATDRIFQNRFNGFSTTISFRYNFY